MKFSTFLTRQLTKHRMSFQDLADELQRNGFSVSKATVGHWKSERTKPPIDDPDFRRALARSFDLDINEMMRLLGYVQTDDDHTSEGLRAAELIDSMPTEKRIAALRILEQLIDLK